jgi:HK97 family phage portal protein
MTIANRFRHALSAFRNNPLESPSTPIGTNLGWLMDGRISSSGVRVNEHTALESAAVQACIRVLADTSASLPLRLLKQASPTHHIAVADHPVSKLLNVAPNPDMTPITLISTAMTALLLWGNAYIEIQRDSNKQPVALWPRFPGVTRTKRDPDGTLYFETNDSPDGKFRRVESADMIHAVGLSLDGLVGMRLAHYSRQIIGASLAQDLWTSTYYRNGGVPALALKTDKLLKPEQKTEMRHEWDALQTGEANQWRLAILDQNLELEQFNVTAADSQLVESKRLSAEQICMLLGVPQVILGISDKAPRSTANTLDLTFLKYSLAPRLIRLEQAFDAKLCPTASYKVKFDTRALLRSDQQQRYESYALGRQWGFLSVDDIHAFEDLPPLPNGLGATYLNPLNMAPAGTVPNDADIVEEEDEED